MKNAKLFIRQVTSSILSALSQSKTLPAETKEIGSTVIAFSSLVFCTLSNGGLHAEISATVHKVKHKAFNFRHDFFGLLFILWINPAMFVD